MRQELDNQRAMLESINKNVCLILSRMSENTASDFPSTLLPQPQHSPVQLLLPQRCGESTEERMVAVATLGFAQFASHMQE
jgi:hypothetical protein